MTTQRASRAVRPTDAGPSQAARPAPAAGPSSAPGSLPATGSTSATGPSPGSGSWTFLTNHAHVLVCLAADPDLRLRDVADRVGITERAAQRILHDLVAAGYVGREKVGRRNSYRLRLDQPMRHPVEAGHAVRALVEALAQASGTRRTIPEPPASRAPAPA